jgi:hypothetical protein
MFENKMLWSKKNEAGGQLGISYNITRNFVIYINQ